MLSDWTHQHVLKALAVPREHADDYVRVCRVLAMHLGDWSAPLHDAFVVVDLFESETDTHPIGHERDPWAQSALAEADRRIAAHVERVRDDLDLALLELHEALCGIPVWDWLQRTLDHNGVELADPPGLSEAAIHDRQQKLGLTFPASYRSFLGRFGASEEAIFVGSDAGNRWVTSNQSLLATLHASRGLELPSHRFAFLGHQGYQLAAFDCVGHPDPPVLHFLEDDEPVEVIAPCFTQWVRHYATDVFMLPPDVLPHVDAAAPSETS